jgi:uncharacterized membrane protein YjgN (DUF898 family)
MRTVTAFTFRVSHFVHPRRPFMTGAFQVRVVAAILIVLGCCMIAPYAIAFFRGVQVDDTFETTFKTSVELGEAIIVIILALWLFRGSDIASYLICAFAILGIGGFLAGIPTILASGARPGLLGGALMAGVTAVGLLICGYVWWAVTFSKKVRAELARRRQANKIRDREERRRFYRQAVETAKD